MSRIRDDMLYMCTVGGVVRLVVCGGKRFKDLRLLERALDAAHAKRLITTLITGGLPGAEEMAHYWAVRTGIERIITIPAKPDLLGRRSLVMRNHEIVNQLDPEGVVAFAGGGETEHMVEIAKDKGLPVWRVPPDWR